jgi:hypothetical protein
LVDPIADRVLTLRDLQDTERFECLGWVPWFDEHQQFDAKGNLVRDVNEEWLESFCRNNNERGETGDFTAFGPGHTVPHVRDERGQIVKASLEGDQPPHWGYCAEWSVKKLPDGTPAAGAVRYVKKRVELPTSKGIQILPGPQAVESFPWRSIEYSPAKHDAPYAALLRRPPERNVGATVSYARGHDTILRGVPLRCSSKRRARAAVLHGDRLFFSMEMNMDPMDPSMPPNAMAPDDEFRQKFERCMTDSYPHLGKMHDEARAKFEAPPPAPGGAAASATDTTLPGDKKPEMPADDKDMDKYSRDMQAIFDRKYAGRIAALETERDQERKARKLDDAKARCTTLANEGHVFDPVKMLQRFERIEIAQRDDEMDFIRSIRKTDEAPTDIFNTGEPERFERDANGQPQMSQKEASEITALMRRKGYGGEDAFDRATNEYRAGKK